MTKNVHNITEKIFASPFNVFDLDRQFDKDIKNIRNDTTFGETESTYIDAPLKSDAQLWREFEELPKQLWKKPEPTLKDINKKLRYMMFLLYFCIAALTAMLFAYWF